MYPPESKPKCSKNKYKQETDKSIAKTERKQGSNEHIYIELDLKCSCPQSTINHNAAIQFSRRYLHCQSSMPVAILRSYIQQILPHSSLTQLSFYDSRDHLLQDSHLLSSLTPTASSLHIPIRFTLFNTITSLPHCSCSSSSSFEQHAKASSLSSSPTVIKREVIEQALSTCSLIHTTTPSTFSPCLSSSSSSSSSGRNEPSNCMSIVNLLTPPSSHASLSTESVVDGTNITDQSMIDEITSQFGEICPPLTKRGRSRSSRKGMSTNIPLDLSLKKRPSFDYITSQTKWIKT